jgi:hypothetical protein
MGNSGKMRRENAKACPGCLTVKYQEFIDLVGCGGGLMMSPVFALRATPGKLHRFATTEGGWLRQA